LTRINSTIIFGCVTHFYVLNNIRQCAACSQGQTAFNVSAKPAERYRLE